MLESEILRSDIADYHTLHCSLDLQTYTYKVFVDGIETQAVKQVGLLILSGRWFNMYCKLFNYFLADV